MQKSKVEQVSGFCSPANDSRGVRKGSEMATYVLVEDEDVGTSLVKSVSGTETGETATDDDDARHCDI